MDGEKIKTIQEFKAPNSKKELQSYLGFLNFYRRFIEKFAHVIAPTIDLVKKDTPWRWEERHEAAFQESKKVFLKEIIIKFPNFNNKFYLNTDASTLAIGGELYQLVDGERATIGFASRTLKSAEKSYTTTEIEALALVYCCANNNDNNDINN